MTTALSYPVRSSSTGDLNSLNNRTKSLTGKQSLKLLTQNDSKVLGAYTKKLSKTAPPKQFTTRAFKTIKSNFTPNINKAATEQLYLERRELISNWFASWSDSQRKRFLDVIFKQCRQSQLIFVQNWFSDHVPLRHLDPTRVLPRCLSLYVFSFLDPRSLCRASCVSWQWKFITEQDYLWSPKCLRQGWFLPYEPEESELGAWKRHYIACLHTLDVDVLAQRSSSDLYGAVGDGTTKKQRRDKKKVLTLKEKREVLEIRPPWQPPDRTPRDLDRAAKALSEGYNPNDPVVDKSLLLHHNKWGVARSRLAESTPNFSRMIAEARDPNKTVLSDSPERTRKFGTLRKSMDALDLTSSRQHTLSEKVRLETFEERRLMELVAQPWEPPPPAKLPVSQTAKIASGGSYPLPWKQQGTQPLSKAYLHQKNPRIVFISSRVPAADVLVDAVNFGIIPIVYEYEGATLESLMVRLDRCLQGRNARSIGIFAHSEIPGELRLVHGATVTIDTLDDPDFVQFFQAIATHVVSNDEGGHVDIFVPLASTEAGMEIIIQLNVLTGMTFTSPTGIIGNYNHVNSEWLKSPETDAPPSHYFCPSKLNVWANTADQVKEACQVTKSLIGRYFQQKHRDVVAQVTGQVIFDATGQVDITGIDVVTNTIIDGLISLGEQQNDSDEKSNVKPLEYLGTYLLEKAGRRDVDYFPSLRSKQKPGDTLMRAPTMDAKSLTAALNLNEKFEESLQNSTVDEAEADSEVAVINGKEEKEKSNMEAYEEKLVDTLQEEDQIEEEIVEEVVDGDMVMKPSPAIRTLKTVTVKSDPEFETTLSSVFADDVPFQSGPLTFRGPKDHSTMRTGIPRPLTAQQFKDHPEKRTPIAREVLSSEVAYMRTLDIIRTRFHMPIKAALTSNRAIISAHNAQMIFSDVLVLADISRRLVEDLKDRLDDWSSQSCLGDIFVRFGTKLKAYANFLNNYSLILATIERCLEQTPVFRAFLKRHERQPDTKMLSLPELFLAPTRRIGEYVTLLTWFQTYTPSDHNDRRDLTAAIRKLRDFDKFIQETKERAEKERELFAIQNKIIRCPVLVEANRYFLRQMDVAHLRPPTEAILPELRVYQHIEMLGLYLFNDSLVITRRTTKNFPFERSVEQNYRFETCAALNRLRVEDIPDTKYVKNAFNMYTPRQSWTVSADSPDDKVTWVSLLENTIRACLATR